MATGTIPSQFNPTFKQYINTTSKATTANAWEYTGKSITIPSGKRAIVQGYLQWASGKPIGFGLDGSSTASTPYRCYESGLTVYSCSFILGSGTYYIYEKRSTVPSSNNTLIVEGFEFDSTN